MGAAAVETTTSLGYPPLSPDLQVSFYHRLIQIESQLLHAALSRTVRQLDIAELDRELSMFVEGETLNRVASFGLRGELFFPVPILLDVTPSLLGYYRLLLGFSQKEFYNKGPFGKFKRLEDGLLAAHLRPEIKELCRSLIASSSFLVDALDNLSLSLVRDLQLLTLGPQFRGSRNTVVGQESTRQVFELIKSIVAAYARQTSDDSITVVNSSGREVTIEFSSDPDIQIIERMPTGIRPTVAIEIKGGSDRSNIHNRIGEAEKSHQKARKSGFFEFWTILRADVDMEVARRESPSTSRFFFLDRIRKPGSDDYAAFRDMLVSLVGIRSCPENTDT